MLTAAIEGRFGAFPRALEQLVNYHQERADYTTLTVPTVPSPVDARAHSCLIGDDEAVIVVSAKGPHQRAQLLTSLDACLTTFLRPSAFWGYSDATRPPDESAQRRINTNAKSKKRRKSGSRHGDVQDAASQVSAPVARELFLEMDRDNDGFLNIDDWTKSLLHFDSSLKEKELRSAYRALSDKLSAANFLTPGLTYSDLFAILTERQRRESRKSASNRRSRKLLCPARMLDALLRRASELAAPPEPYVAREKWGVCSSVQVFSDSAGRWLPGRVMAIEHDDSGEWLRVIYKKADSREYTKQVAREDPDGIRAAVPMPRELGRRLDFCCFLARSMKWGLASLSSLELPRELAKLLHGTACWPNIGYVSSDTEHRSLASC